VAVLGYDPDADTDDHSANIDARQDGVPNDASTTPNSTLIPDPAEIDRIVGDLYVLPYMFYIRLV
jgi:hypothetical protein